MIAEIIDMNDIYNTMKCSSIQNILAALQYLLFSVFSHQSDKGAKANLTKL